MDRQDTDSRVKPPVPYSLSTLLLETDGINNLPSPSTLRRLAQSPNPPRDLTLFPSEPRQLMYLNYAQPYLQHLTLVIGPMPEPIHWNRLTAA